MIRPSLRTAHAADFSLYHVTDSALSGGIDAVPGVVLAAVRGGAGAIQLRDKDASDADLLELVRACRERLASELGPRAQKVPLFVNDRLGVAEAARCHLHVGQSDVAAAAAREVLGEELMIGLSAGTAGQVRAALAEDTADVLGIGPIRATATKADAAPPLGLEGLGECLDPWRQARHVSAASAPLAVAIGGIDHRLAPEIAATGVDGLCVVSAIAAAPDPAAAAGRLREAIDQGRSSSRP
ncbi:thiamine phosphate synthase [Brachybacterium sp. GCM10030268]|uniref:thiamine phosphate synthase n=1 Tax=Brachybacterium sp. GCM10030268 TaxID=3273382 RepID=UPI00361C2D61